MRDVSTTKENLQKIQCHVYRQPDNSDSGLYICTELNTVDNSKLMEYLCMNMVEIEDLDSALGAIIKRKLKISIDSTKIVRDIPLPMKISLNEIKDAVNTEIVLLSGHADEVGFGDWTWKKLLQKLPDCQFLVVIGCNSFNPRCSSLLWLSQYIGSPIIFCFDRIVCKGEILNSIVPYLVPKIIISWGNNAIDRSLIRLHIKKNIIESLNLWLLGKTEKDCQFCVLNDDCSAVSSMTICNTLAENKSISSEAREKIERFGFVHTWCANKYGEKVTVQKLKELEKSMTMTMT